jgi:tyrosyl-tRNA synthetase
MDSYYTLLTDLPDSEFKSLIAERPRDAKIKLAKYIINWLHDGAAADAAEAEFLKVISGGGIPDEMPELAISAGPHKLAPLLVQAGFVTSNGEAIRKMKEGAVKIDGEKVVDFQREYQFDKSVVLQLGNRKFVRLMV